MKRITVFIVIMAFTVALACRGNVCAEVPPGAVAVVNGEAISREEFGNALVYSFGKAAIGSIVDRMLIRQEAEKQGVSISEEELQKRKELEAGIRIRGYLREARLSPEEFGAAAQKIGLTPEQLRKRIIDRISPDVLRSTLLTEKLLEDRVDISPGDVRDYFERTRGKRYLVAHIQVKSRELATELLEKLNQDPGKWEDLLAKHTLDRASVSFRGRLPVFSAKSDLGKVLSGMEPEQLTLYRGDQSWHIIRLLSIVPPADVKYENVRDKVRRELLSERVAQMSNRWLSELVSQAKVVTNLSASTRDRAVLGEDVAAYVNGKPLELSRLRDVLIQQFGPNTIAAFVNRELVLQAATRQGIEASPKEVEERMASLGEFLMIERASSLKMTMEELEEFLDENGIDPEQFSDRLARDNISRSDVRAALLAEKAVADDIQVSEQELQEAYSEMGKERLIGREIVVDSEIEARRIYNRVQGGSNFRALVLAHSADPLVWLTRGLERSIGPSHPYYEHLKDTDLGEVSYFKKEGRYHIVRVVGKKAPSTLPALESVRTSILRKVRKQKARSRIVAWLEKLSAEANLEVDLG